MKYDVEKNMIFSITTYPFTCEDFRNYSFFVVVFFLLFFFIRQFSETRLNGRYFLVSCF